MEGQAQQAFFVLGVLVANLPVQVEEQLRSLTDGSSGNENTRPRSAAT